MLENNAKTVRVNGFCLASNEVLLQIKKYFGLVSNEARLKSIQAYFKNTEKKDPNSYELILLDRYLFEAPHTPDACRIDALSSEDIRVGESYDDLRSKLSMLEAPILPPFELKTLFDSPDIILNEVRKPFPICGAKLISGENALLKAGMRIGGTHYLLRTSLGASAIVTGASTGESVNADVLVYLTATDKNADTDSLISAVASLVINNRKIYAGRARLTRRGFLQAVVSIAKGAEIVTGRLCEAEQINDPLLTLNCLRDGILMTVRRDSAKELINISSEYGIDAKLCGTVNDNDRLVFNHHELLDISASFIRNNACISAKAEAKLGAVQRPETSELAVSNMSAGGIFRERAMLDGSLVTALSIGGSSFDTGLNAAIEAVTRLVSAGAEYESIKISVEAVLPKPDTDAAAGDAVSMLMGLYRARAELCLMSQGSSCRFGEQPYCGITAAALVQSPLCETSHTHRGRLYLLSPRVNADGLPSFGDLRRMFGYVHSLKLEGKLISACSALSAKYCLSSENALKLAQNSPIGSIIAESEQELDGKILDDAE